MAPLDLEEGRVTIFKNDKGDNAARPDYRGELKTPDGTQLKVALWVKESKAGPKYLSGQVEPLEQGQQQQAAVGAADDDLPF